MKSSHTTSAKNFHVLQFARNEGTALNSSKVVSLVPPPKTNVISLHCTLPGLRAVPSILAIWLARYPLWGKIAIWGGNSKKKTGPNFFYGSMMPIQNTFCKKVGLNRSIQPSAVTQTFYTRLYGVTTTN